MALAYTEGSTSVTSIDNYYHEFFHPPQIGTQRDSIYC